jgi:hypothetical protein
MQANPTLTPANGSWLSDNLRERVETAAAARGLDPAALCEQWVLAAVTTFEQQHGLYPGAGSGDGRCSIRTGSRTLGPVPLPVQQ